MRIGLMIGPEKGRYRHKVAQLIADAADGKGGELFDPQFKKKISHGLHLPSA